MFTKASGFRGILIILGLFFSAALLVHCTSSENEAEQSQSQSQQAQKAKQDVPELADAMGQLQKYTHKYALAVEAENHELATFYFHEVRASVDGIKQNIPGYEGYDIKRFTEQFLDPTLPPLEKALANKNWEEVQKRTIDMVNGCNSCHNATAHGFVNIKPGFNNNPYNQDFSVPE